MLQLTTLTKLWLLTLFILIYVSIQYHVANSRQMPATFNSGEEMTDVAVNGEFSLFSRYERQLKKIVDKMRFEENILKTVGEKTAKEIAYNIGRQILITQHEQQKPSIYVVTPTYRRPEQMAELTRLAQTLMHVRNLYWLLVEDAAQKSVHVELLLKKSGIRYIHLKATSTNTHSKKKAKGVANRNEGLRWIRENAKEGVLYFADDDNTYDLELFNQIRDTKKVSMWPVGLVTQTGVSTPIVKNGRISGFYDGWIGGRKFAVDMAGFAVNIQFLFQRPKAKMAYKTGYEEDSFLRSLAPLEPDEIEIKADNCTKILVWHTQTKKNPLAKPVDVHKFENTNLMKLKEFLV